MSSEVIFLCFFEDVESFQSDKPSSKNIYVPAGKHYPCLLAPEYGANAHDRDVAVLFPNEKVSVTRGEKL